MQNWQVIRIATVAALLAAAAAALWMRRRDHRQVKYMLDDILAKVMYLTEQKCQEFGTITLLRSTPDQTAFELLFR